MAQKAGSGFGIPLSTQSSVAERRLRPIYELLNTGNNKKVLYESDRVLKKQSDLLCCKVLKSLALIRMGREEEATNILNAVLAIAPTDDEVLQAMTLAYRELCQLENICKIYEAATAKEPGNEDLLSHLFMSYVRIGDYKKQKQAAFALYKASPKNPYYFWAIMSLYLCATTGEDDENRQFSFQLAQRMIIKMEKAKKMEQEQETHLYLMILESQNKYKEALDVLEGPLGAKLKAESFYLSLVPLKKIEYYKKIGLWARVNIFTKTELYSNPDQWNLYLDYIDSVFHLSDEMGINGEENSSFATSGECDCTASAANEFFLQNQTNNKSLRGPYLAQIELVSKQLSRKDAPVASIFELLLQYFGLFAHKAMCFSDVKSYLHLLSRSEFDNFFSQCENKLISLDDKGIPKTIEEVYRHTCVFQIRRFSGEYIDLSVEERVERVMGLFKMYSSVYPLISKYQDTELKPTDMYVILGAHLLWDLWVDTRENRFFYVAILALESAIDLSPSDYHLRFILLKFYNRAGALGASSEAYDGLSLKNIQLDSIGYLIYRQARTSGHFKMASHHFVLGLKVFSRNYKYTVDYIISAYKCGSFDKIREFIKLRDRLSNSQHFAIYNFEIMLLGLLTKTSNFENTVQFISSLEIDPEKEDIVWSSLHDNRDFAVVVSYDSPERSLSSKDIKKNFELEQRFLRLRSLITRSLVASVFLSEDIYPARRSELSFNNRLTVNNLPKNAESSENETRSVRLVRSIKTIANDIMAYLEKFIENQLIPSSKYLVQGPDWPQIQAYIPHAKYFVLCSNLVLAVHSRSEEDKTPLMESITEEFDKLVQNAVKRAEKLSSLFIRETIFEEIFFCLESISFTAVLCGVCRSFIKGSNSKKNKKKKGGNSDQEKFTCAFNEMLTKTSLSLNNLQQVIEENVKKLSSPDTLFGDSKDPLLISLSSAEFFKKGVSLISENLERSYEHTYENFQKVLAHKLSYLKSLKL